MDRCQAAYDFHHQGYNCAQSVVKAFSDLLVQTPNTAEPDATAVAADATAVAAAGGFGGGLGGSHTELCGAISGGVLVLSLIFPHTDGKNTESKRRISALAREFRMRFEKIFGQTRCGELLAARPGPGEQTTAANKLGITAHCDLMIVTAVELAEKLLQESR